MKLKALLGVLLALGLAGSAMADIIDFAGLGPGIDSGTISYAGGASPLVGTDILINFVSAAGTPANSGPLFPITGGSLNFTSGGFVSYNSGEYKFAGGGTFTITGNGPGPSSGELLSGTIISAKFFDGMFGVALATGADRKNVDLLAFFGITDPGLPWQFSGTVHTASTPPVPADPTNPAAFSVNTSGSTNIRNSVPDGGMTVMLLGGALVGLATLRRKFQL